jgi:hypothetical protein
MLCLRQLRIDLPAFGADQIEEHVPGIGLWGGTCSCPSGQVYSVGDNRDYCSSLACFGGTSGACGEGDFGGRRVTCGPVPTSRLLLTLGDGGPTVGAPPGAKHSLSPAWDALLCMDIGVYLEESLCWNLNSTDRSF